MSKATHRKTREDVCSAKQRQSFKHFRGKVTNTCKNINRVFNATCQRSHYQNLCTRNRSGASDTSSEIMQLRHEREHLTVHHRNLETETLTCQRAVGSLEAQAAHVPRFRGMFEVERQISNTQQADVLGLRADRVQISQRLDSSNEKVAQLEARCSEFWASS